MITAIKILMLMRLLGPKSNSPKEERRKRENRPNLRMARTRMVPTQNKSF